jgi:hypothetical protein
MSKIDTMLSEFKYISTHPKEAVENDKKATGKGAVGICPSIRPRKSSTLPAICRSASGETDQDLEGPRLSAAVCVLDHADVMEYELSGAYDNLTAVIFSSPCDTLKCMAQKWKAKCPSIQLTHPQNRVIEASKPFLAGEYQIVREKLEAVIGERSPTRRSQTASGSITKTAPRCANL